MHFVRFSFFLVLLTSLTACDPSDPIEDLDASGSDGGTAQTLTCSSFTLCTYAEVTTYAGTIAPAAGGAVADGTYRLAWVEASTEARAGATADLTAIEISGGSFLWTGGVQSDLGSFSTDGATITFHPTARCELGAQVDTDDRTFDYRYTATASELRLHETISGADGWEQVSVFVRTDALDVCDLVSDVPSSPGDSAQCNASNCFCAVAVGGPLEESDCPF
jgi:hypothetical protein